MVGYTRSQRDGAVILGFLGSVVGVDVVDEGLIAQAMTRYVGVNVF